MKIRDSKILKSKDLFCAHFWTKTGDSFLKWWKTTNILPQIFFQGKIFKTFCILGQKNWKGWSHNLETFHEENLGVVKKNLENEKIMAATLHCEFWYLKYLPIFFQAWICRHIIELWFLIRHSTRPQTYYNFIAMFRCSNNRTSWLAWKIDIMLGSWSLTAVKVNVSFTWNWTSAM